MKRILFIALLTVAAFCASFAQSQVDFPGYFKADNADLEITYTNYTATSDDTTDNWSTIFPSGIQTMVGLAREVYLIAIATDSIEADINILLRNSSLTSLTSVYADSIIGTSNTSNVKVITMKDATVNRMTIYDQLKIGTLERATGQGTTTGRSLKWYIKFVL